MRVRSLFLLLTFVLAVGIVPAQTPTSRANLTTLLNQVSEKYSVKLSFNPNFTKDIYPKNTNINGDVETVLIRVLSGTGMGFKKMSSTVYYIYRSEEQSKPIQAKPKKPKLKKESPKPDSLRLHTVVYLINDTTRLSGRPELSTASRETAHKDSLLPKFALKSNLLYDATSTMNLGVEIGLAPKWSLDISNNFNPWTFSDNRKMKHWLIQPEARYWLCQRFNGHFFGLHAHYAMFNVGGMLPWGFNSGKMFGVVENTNILNHRYEGWLLGAGLGYGYHCILGNRWGLEFEIGVGYAYIDYDKYRCEKCGEQLKSGHRNYFGPTKAAVTLIFMVK